MPESLQDILEQVKSKGTEGSFAFHIKHTWNRELESGVWCEDCNEWVIFPDRTE